MFTLAHLSDIHLAPLPSAPPASLFSKRLFGFQSWHRNRCRVHIRAIADAIRDDIKRLGPDHVAITGDLVNISLEKEFEQALDWLRSFGPPDRLSVAPGNHDAYVPLAWERGMGMWHEYMSGDAANAEDNGGQRFPYLRRRGDIAIIGLSTAVPTPALSARGRLGKTQREDLAALLEQLSGGEVFRVVLIHHPPLPGQNKWRKAMADTRQFVGIIRKFGADLILHGHNHRQMYAEIDGNSRMIPVYGVAAASARRTGRRPESHYNIYRIERAATDWRCNVTVRVWDGEAYDFRTIEPEARKEHERSDQP